MNKFSVEMTEKAKMKNIIFTVEDLEIGNEEVNCSVTSVLIDGVEYQGEYVTWAGRNLDNLDLFEDILNIYIRGGKFFVRSFSKEWSVFNSLKDSAVKENGIITVLPVVEYGCVDRYELELATDNYLFYIDFGSDFLMLDTDGNVVTDVEFFYTDALYDEIASIAKGETVCHYISPSLKEWVNSDEGKTEISDVLGSEYNTLIRSKRF